MLQKHLIRIQIGLNYLNIICAEDDSYFEPLSSNYLVHFIRLMEVYQSSDKEDFND
jgi:hypothetical protein